MKKELQHLKEKFHEDCARCQKITNLLKLHAKTCQRHGCRVPRCLELRYMLYILYNVQFLYFHKH